jgi:tRNA A-37 threonylcarbamoyl transferase component Bud32
MGVVYRAEQQYPHRSVAIKLITPDLSSDSGFRERFMRETEATASLDHPNIIPIYEAGIADALLYIVMRYVDGPDLRAVLLRDGSLSPEQAMNVTDQVGRALDAAVRSRGLIHRDVKPANILLANHNDGASGHVYLCDFGLAKQVGSSSGLTGTGAVIGTIDYMAPEQIREDVVDGRADVYSLGCVVYHLLTGHAPFQGSAAKVMWSHLNEKVPLVSESASVPPATDGVLAKALAKDPLERYQDCGHLVHDLRAALSGSSLNPLPGSPASGYHPTVPGSAPDVVAPPPALPRAASRRRWVHADRRRVVIAGAVAVIALAAALVYAATRGGNHGGVNALSFDLGARPSLLAGGASGVWVAEGSRTGPRGTLTRLAAQRDDWAGPYQLTSRPVGLAVGSGSVWVVESTASRTLLEQFDTTGREIRTVPLPGRTACADRQYFYTCNPVLTANTIWVPLDRSVVPVTREGHVGTPFPVKDGVVADVAIAGSRLWIIAGRAIEDIRLDQPPLKVGTYYQFGTSMLPQHLISRQQLLWVSTLSTTGSSALQFVTAQGILRTIPVRGLQRLAASGSSLWAGQLARSDCNAVGTVNRFDLQTGASAGQPVPVGNQPGAMATAPGALWVLTFDPCTHVRRLVRVPT